MSIVWSLWFTVEMSEYTSLLVYTLFFIIVAACFLLRTTEFVTSGLTIENLFDNFIEKESANFVVHHLKRTSLSIIVHSCLPLGWLVCIRSSVTFSILTMFLCSVVCFSVFNRHIVGEWKQRCVHVRVHCWAVMFGFFAHRQQLFVNNEMEIR